MTDREVIAHVRGVAERARRAVQLAPDVASTTREVIAVARARGSEGR